MKSYKLLAVVLILCVVLSSVAGCATESVSGSTTNATTLDSTVASGNNNTTNADEPYKNTIATARTDTWKALANSKAAGASIAVMDNGQIVYSEGFGMANREQNIPVSKETQFNIGSCSKVFAAVSIMLLVDDHKVGLDNKVTDYLPEFSMADERYKDITVRMLLNHTSGLPGTIGGNNFSYFQENPNLYTDVITTLKTAHLKHAPGAMAIYCNDGFTLAEMVVAKASGIPYIDFVSGRIFQPLDMSHSGPSVGEQKDRSIAGYYDANKGKHYPPEVVTLIGAGGLSMSPADLCRFADSFSTQGKHILSDTSLAEMKKVQPSLFHQQVNNEAFLPYGLGWDATSLPELRAQGIQFLGKGGNTTQFSSYIASSPDKRIAVAITITGQTGEGTQAAIHVLETLLQEKGLMQAPAAQIVKPATTPISDEALSQQGLWLGSEGLVKVSFDNDNGTINLSKLNGGEETPWISLTYNNGIFYDKKGNRFRFIDIDGKTYFIGYQQVAGIILQKLNTPGSTAQLRIDMDGKTWLRRNAKWYEETNGTDHIGTSSLIANLPGYLDFGGIKKVEGSDYASIAATALRDQSELVLFDKDGTTWARTYDLVFSPASSAKKLAAGSNTATIGAEGYNEWFTLAEGQVLSFQMPKVGRVLVVSPDGDSLFDSLMDSGEVYAPAGSFIECDGEIGTGFTVQAR